MPYRRAYRKTTKKTAPTMKRKTTFASAKKVIRQVDKRKRKSNSDTFTLVCKTQANIVPAQGVLVANSFFTTVPLMDPVLSIGVTQNAEFNLYKNMYDQVRINSVMIKITPKANVLDQAVQQNDLYNSSGDGMVHSVIDRDGSPPQSKNVFQRYPSYKKYSVFKPFTRKYNVKWPTGVWLDTQNIYEDTTLLKRLGCTGGIYLYAENILEDVGELLNEPFADIQIWYGVVFRGKVQGSLVYDVETGGVTVLSADALPPGTMTPLSNIRGSTIYDSIAEQLEAGTEPGIKISEIPVNSIDQD